MLEKMKSLFVEEEGQALTEYGLIVGLIVVGCIALIKGIGPIVKGYYNDILIELRK